MKVILTFDYEMFFGKSGTIDACLIEPTNEIINVLKKYDAHASFFVDTTFLLFLLKNGLVKEYDRIEQQLIELIQLGHRLELHIHPHWLDAKYDKRSSKFMFPTYNRYILSSCEIDIQKKLFSDGISLLRAIGMKAGCPTYKPIAYRAGGWCFDLNEDVINMLRDGGIRVDSSVIPRRKCINAISAYNYLMIKSDQPYRFNKSLLENDSDGAFLEFPISIYRISPYCKLKALLKRRTNSIKTKRFGDGTSIFDIQTRRLKDRLLYNITWSYGYYSTDASCEFLYEKVRNYKNNILTIVGHPKCTTWSSLDFLTQLGMDEKLSLCTIYDLYIEKYNGF